MKGQRSYCHLRRSCRSRFGRRLYAIMFLTTFRAKAVGEVGFGATADVGFQPLPLPCGVADLVAKGADGQQTLQGFYVVQSLLQIGYQMFLFGQRGLQGLLLLFKFGDVTTNPHEPDSFSGAVTQWDFGRQNFCPAAQFVGVRFIFVDDRFALEHPFLIGLESEAASV